VAPGDAQVLFPRGSGVPRPVQDFAWQVIDTRCRYQAHERAQRAFWVHAVRTQSLEAATIYRIAVVADLPWRKSDPSAFIEMTLVDEGHVRLAALSSSFIPCAP
jgi:hypothetical protein